MHAPFVGGHPAIDFLNTAFAPGGNRVETIGDGRALLVWLIEADLLDDAAATRLQRRLGAKGMDTLAAEARKLRDWAKSWIERWRANPNRDYSGEIATLNKLLAHEATRREVVAAKEGFKIAEQHMIENTEALLALLAAQIATLITEEEPSLIKLCAGHGCTLMFVDRTKAHRRLFCSASACGNRAKVAAFRQRRRV